MEQPRTPNSKTTKFSAQTKFFILFPHQNFIRFPEKNQPKFPKLSRKNQPSQNFLYFSQKTSLINIFYTFSKKITNPN